MVYKKRIKEKWHIHVIVQYKFVYIVNVRGYIQGKYNYNFLGII